MKIAFILREFPVLSETFILNQITGLIDEGHEVDIYAEFPRGEGTVHPAVEKYQLLKKTFYWSPPHNKLERLVKAQKAIFNFLPKQPKPILSSLNVARFNEQAWSLRLLFKVITLIPNGPYDIIQCHFGFNGKQASILRELGAVQGKLVTTFHGIDITRFIQDFGEDYYAELFEHGDLFLAISERWKERLIELGCPSQKVNLHRLGINIDKFSFQPKESLSPDNIRLISVARLVEKKGIEYGIRAVAKLIPSYSNIQYEIIGDGPLRTSLEALIREHKAESNIKILGWSDHEGVLSKFRQADAILAPSITSTEGDQEGIPVTLMEAMAIGRPVISTWHSGIPELVQDGVTGFLAPERDSDKLAQRIRELIENPKHYKQMSVKGRMFVEDNFDLKKSNEKLIHFYEGLTHKSAFF